MSTVLKIHHGGKYQHKLELSKSLDKEIAEIKQSHYLNKVEKDEKIKELRIKFTDNMRNLNSNLY